MASLKGKVIAITGAASGIGLATAKLLASHGAILSLADVNQAGLDDALKSLDGEKHIITLVDVSKSSEVNAWVEKTAEKLGKLDGAANLAGVFGKGGLATDATDDDWDFVMNVNGRGIFYSMRAELKSMNEGGAIVNAASVAGLRSLPGCPLYVASKHAVVGITKAVAKDVGPRNIRVNAIAPGGVDTPLLREFIVTMGHKQDKSAQALARRAEPEEMAKVIMFLLSDDASFVTGAVWLADGGWSA